MNEFIEKVVLPQVSVSRTDKLYDNHFSAYDVTLGSRIIGTVFCFPTETIFMLYTSSQSAIAKISI